MISIGNDIISLNDIDIIRTKQSKFYSKILTGAEIELYEEQATGRLPFEIYTWLYWSVKESAYKYLQRITPLLLFSPSKFIVNHLQYPLVNRIMVDQTQLTQGCGFKDEAVYETIINYGENKLYGSSLINQDFIFSVVHSNQNFDKICWGVKLIDNPGTEHQSAAVRKFAIEKLRIYFKTVNISIDKSPYGYPTVIKDDKEVKIPLSLSHHGHRVAYSFQTGL